MMLDFYHLWSARVTDDLTVGTLLVWTVLAFTLWVFLTGGLRSRHIYGAVVIAALLSWVVAGLVVWGGPIVVEWLDAWTSVTG